MDISIVQSFIDPNMGILLAALWVIGYAAKRLEWIPDKFIIFVVAAAGILGACIMSGFTFTSGLQGFLCAAVAVYGNQAIKQIQKTE